MLLSVGGNPAVEFWQRLLEGVDGEMDVVKSYAEEDDDEVGQKSIRPDARTRARRSCLPYTK